MIGTIVAMRIQMTAMPQLVAALHSFVGLAAVLVGIGTFLHKRDADLLNAVLMGEISAGVVIGAITFTGSIIAFGKLQGSAQRRAGQVRRATSAQRADRPGDRRARGAFRDDRAVCCRCSP